MSSFKVIGGRELSGEIKVQGSKNEALQIVASSIIAKNIIINNIPKINDVLSLVNILEFAGAELNWLNNNSLHINTTSLNKEYFESEEYFVQCENTRGSLMFMGPLLARYGIAYIPKTGGDKIGIRPIDTHTLGLISLGATLKKDIKGNYLEIDQVIKDQEVLLDDASVTGTANIIMCASRGTNNLIVYNAASETYISQLCIVLETCGLNISGQSSNRLIISGKADSLYHNNNSLINHNILPDFVEVASFIALAMGTKSEILIKDAGVKNLGQTLKMFEKLGCKYQVVNDDIKVLRQNEYIIQKMYDGSMMKLHCQPWPNISPDILSLGIVAAIQASGVVLFNEKMYEARMFFVDKLIAMGAQIVLCDPHRVVVTGLNWTNKLKSRHLTSPDIRAGIALLIAALGADGESIIDNVDQIDRGYEKIEERLSMLGAKIERIK